MSCASCWLDVRLPVKIAGPRCAASGRARQAERRTAVAMALLGIGPCRMRVSPGNVANPMAYRQITYQGRQFADDPNLVHVWPIQSSATTRHSPLATRHSQPATRNPPLEWTPSLVTSATFGGH